MGRGGFFHRVVVCVLLFAAAGGGRGSERPVVSRPDLREACFPRKHDWRVVILGGRGCAPLRSVGLALRVRACLPLPNPWRAAPAWIEDHGNWCPCDQPTATRDRRGARR